MISKKRGLIFVVLIMFLLINVGLVSSYYDLPIHDDTVYSLGKYLDLPTCVWDCETGTCGDCWYDNDGLYNYGFGKEILSGSDADCEKDWFWDTCNGPQRVGVIVDEDPEGGDCDVSKFNENTPLDTPNINSRKGCWYIIVDQDGGSDNDGAVGAIDEGFILDQDWKYLEYGSKFAVCDGETEDGQQGFHAAKHKAPEGKTYLCADDQFWHLCEGTGVTGFEDENEAEVASAGNIGEVTWANGRLYNCTIDKDGISPIWDRLYIDQDKDGFTDDVDCVDDPKDDPDFCSDIESDTIINCQDDPIYGQCAICINPGAAEICGDKNSAGEEIDNDCNEQTSNDCNLNPWACENRDPPITDNENQEKKPTPNNIYGQALSWLPTADGGRCCGFNYMEDLGAIESAAEFKGEYFTEEEIAIYASGNYVCLHSDNEDLVGYEGDFPVEYCKESDNWCWVSASGLAKYKIFTIKSPEETPYDIVSNAYDWLTCNSSEDIGPLNKYPNLEDIPEDPETGIINKDILLETLNRFSCYKEGNHYAWAECAKEKNKRKNEGVKGRYPGEGLFSLPLSGTETKPGEFYGENVVVQVQKHYGDFYGEQFSLDFSEEQYLNFMVQFCKLESGGEEGTSCKPLSQEELEEDHQFPAFINLKMVGYNDEVLFEKSVLADSVNKNFFDEDKWTHVKVRLDEGIKGVRAIEISSHSGTIKIKVRNFFLSNDNEPTALCSGKASSTKNESSWLTDLDQGLALSNIDGQEICTEIYGPEAWLGKDGDIDEDEGSANCCGNNEEEYYSGKSKKFNNLDSGVNYGCWNSQAIADKETTMNVDFKVKFTEEVKTFVHKPIKADVTIKETHLKCDEDSDGNYLIDNGPIFGSSNYWGELEKTPLWWGYGDSAKSYWSCLEYPLCNGQEVYEKSSCYLVEDGFDELRDGLDDFTCEDLENYVEENYILSECETEIIESETRSVSFSIEESPVMVGEPITYNQYELFQAELISDEENPVEFYFYEPLNGDSDGDIKELVADDLPYENTEIYIMAEINEEFYEFDEITNFVGDEKLFSFPCDKPECIYPVPGIPEEEITITNPNSELYELYYLTFNQATGKMDEEYISEQKTFTEPGNIIVRKVAQQVIFVSPGEDYEFSDEAGFFGCQATVSLEGENKIPSDGNNLDYCSTKGGHFCAPSVTKELPGNEKYTVINSWDTTGITEGGYEIVPSESEDIDNYFSSLILNLKPAEPAFTAKERNETAKVLPARNFISNAMFEKDGVQLAHWEILLDGEVDDSEKGKINISDASVKLEDQETLRSERIAIPKNSSLIFTHNGSLELSYSITLVDKDGESEVIEFNEKTAEIKETKEYSYLRLEFFGPGILKDPMLQLDDGLGAASYNYEPFEERERSGLACCPEDHCWNGYACVESMVDSQYGQLAEHVDLGRDYRCIDGEWKHLPLKWDWNFDRWGFCSDLSQCFVTNEGLPDNSADDFYLGDAPTCINDEEYIFDHYCESGNWTSRTKFAASKLIEVSENDDFVLYCTEYRDALLEYEYKDGQLGGTGGYGTDEAETKDISLEIGDTGNQDKEIKICHPIGGDGDLNRLIPDQDNSCINNVCVLKFKGGDKVAFATTLNRNISGTNSFLIALGVPGMNVEEVCQGTGEEGFIKCDLSGLDLFDDADLWYEPSKKIVIFGKEGINVDPSLGKKIADWFKDLFGIENELSGQQGFIAKAKNFNELYLLSNGNKKVSAMQEFFANNKTLVAEYENFQTPICDYVDVYNKVPPVIELDVELQEILSGVKKLSCGLAVVNNQTSSDKVKVEIVSPHQEPLDYFWPQLTGKMRMS